MKYYNIPEPLMKNMDTPSNHTSLFNLIVIRKSILKRTIYELSSSSTLIVYKVSEVKLKLMPYLRSAKLNWC